MANKNVTTTQLTSKSLKLQKLLAVITIFIGVTMSIVVMGSSQNTQDYPRVPVIVLGVGLVWYVITRIRIWWSHD